MLFEFELGQNPTDLIKNISCAKGKGTIDHNREKRRFNKFRAGFKKLIHQTESGRPIIEDFKTVI